MDLNTKTNPNKAHKPDKADKASKADIPEKPNNPVKADRPNKADRQDKTDHPVQADKPYKAVHPVQAANSRVGSRKLARFSFSRARGLSRSNREPRELELFLKGIVLSHRIPALLMDLRGRYTKACVGRFTADIRRHMLAIQRNTADI